MTQPRLLLDADRYESDYGTNNTQTSNLVRGQNIVTVNKNTPYNVLNIDGRTLVNLLGRDGNCEDVSKWSLYQATLALDSTNKTIGNNSLKTTISGAFTEGNGSSSLQIPFKSGKKYLLVADLKNGNATSISVSVVSQIPTTTTAITDTTKFNVSYKKFTFGSDVTSGITTRVLGSNGQYGYADAIRVYELSDAEYNAIDTMTADQIATKYPYVDDVKHVQNPYLIKSGQNLLPPFQEWTVHANAVINNAYNLTLNATATGQRTSVKIPIAPNQTYTISYTGQFYADYYDSNNAYINWNLGANTFTTPVNASYLLVYTDNNAASGTFTFNNPMLNLGSTALPFAPQNNDYLFTTTTLASSVDGSVKDCVYYKDGLYYKSKRFIADMALDGSLAWNYAGSATGIKNVNTTSNLLSNASGLSDGDDKNNTLVKYDGKIAIDDDTLISGWITGDRFRLVSSNIYVSISSTDSGWGDAYTPTVGEIQAYFNGWKMYEMSGGHTVSYNGTGTKAWVERGNIGTAAGTNDWNVVNGKNGWFGIFQPYKLTYQLANEQEELIPFEGDIQLHSGGNQIEYGEGVIVREKANPIISADGNNYIINSNFTGETASRLNNRLDKTLSIYKNGKRDFSWKPYYSSAYGNEYRYITKLSGMYDPTAEYTVSYIVLQDGSFRSSVNSASAVYNTNLRNIVNQISQELADVTTAEKALELRFQNFGIKGLGERVEVISRSDFNYNATVNTRQDFSVSFSRSFSKNPQVIAVLTSWGGTNTFKMNYLGVVAVTTTSCILAINADSLQNYTVTLLVIGT